MNEANKVPISYRTWVETTFKHFGPVPSKDMQTLPLSFAPIFMKDAHSAESNENSILKFLFFRVNRKNSSKIDSFE